MKENIYLIHICYDILNFHKLNLVSPYRYLGPSPSDGDLAYTMTSAAFRSVYEQISHSN